MPARFYFDFEDGYEAIRDDEGVEADDSNQAIDQALAGVDDVRASGELQGLGPNWHLVVRDAQGAEIKRIPL